LSCPLVEKHETIDAVVRWPTAEASAYRKPPEFPTALPPLLNLNLQVMAKMRW